MAIFDKVAPLIIAAEGDEVTNGADDYGGETKYGISKRQYPGLDIAALTEPEALQILERDFWIKYRCGEIENQGIANQIFFMFVNMNPLHAAAIVQAAINGVGRGIIVTPVDNVMGTRTIQYVNTLAEGWLSNRIRLEAISYYLQLTDHDKTQTQYFRGWVRRALTK